jgi:hypothetical protein
MTKTVANLTLPVVVDQIETVLESYPYHPYQQAFAIPDLRQRLIAYVLNRISSYYTVLEEGENSTDSINCSSDRKLQIKNLVTQGIPDILQQHWEWSIHHIPSELESGLTPSHWFG